jgi:hypothetical protein
MIANSNATRRNGQLAGKKVIACIAVRYDNYFPVFADARYVTG